MGPIGRRLSRGVLPIPPYRQPFCTLSVFLLEALKSMLLLEPESCPAPCALKVTKIRSHYNYYYCLSAGPIVVLVDVLKLSKVCRLTSAAPEQLLLSLLNESHSHLLALEWNKEGMNAMALQ